MWPLPGVRPEADLVIAHDADDRGRRVTDEILVDDPASHVYAGIDPHEPNEAVQHETRPDQQDERQRRFRDPKTSLTR